MSVPTAVVDPLLLVKQAFADFERGLEGMVAGHIHERRKAAYARFVETGLPPAKSEAWKYTSARPFLAGNPVLEPLSKRAPQGHMPLLRQGFVAGKNANILCTLSGRYEPTLSTILSPIHEVELMGMHPAERKNSRTMESYFATIADATDNPFVDLNTALSSHGIVIRVPEGKAVKAQTILYHLADATVNQPLAQPRVLIVVGACSTLDITEVYESQGGHLSTTNAVLEVWLGEGASINITKQLMG
jgi:Fe-S cluster assembly protein SufD